MLWPQRLVPLVAVRPGGDEKDNQKARKSKRNNTIRNDASGASIPSDKTFRKGHFTRAGL